MTVQLDHFVRVRLVSCFGFDLTFRTTGHDPWFDFIAKCQAHGLRERGYAPAFVRFSTSHLRLY
ncbi:MAG: hypothetical protein J6P19_03665 [Acetobacter sp.]|nr:hypothetical protein [Acetobacter sp.]